MTTKRCTYALFIKDVLLFKDFGISLPFLIDIYAFAWIPICIRHESSCLKLVVYSFVCYIYIYIYIFFFSTNVIVWLSYHRSGLYLVSILSKFTFHHSVPFWQFSGFRVWYPFSAYSKRFRTFDTFSHF